MRSRLLRATCNLGGLSGPDTTADAPDPVTPRYSSLYAAQRPTVPVHRRDHSADRRLEHAEPLNSTQTDIDDRQAITCANIKAANVDLNTIQVNTGGDPTSTLLQNCASSTDKF
jgi:hypothetical protein